MADPEINMKAQTILNMGKTRPLFVYFRSFLNTMTNIVNLSFSRKV